MQNDFMNAFSSLVTDLEQQLNELQATTTKQSELIRRLTAVNRNLIEQNERLNNENRQLANTNAQQNDLLTKLLGKSKTR